MRFSASSARIVNTALLLLLAACSSAPNAAPVIVAVESAQDDAARAVAPAVAAVESAVAGAAVPAIIAVQEAVQAVLPAPAPAALPQVSPAAAALIVRWEVSSPAHYTRRLDRPIWPQGASGVTWGIGYDGGHATARDIRTAWRAHGEVERLATTAGIVGTRARDALPAYRDIVTPYAYAADVFAEVSLPIYHASTRRAFGDRFDVLPPDAAGALVSMVYNRGASMAGERNREKRVIRDTCIPAGDLACIGAQLRGMCRLWVGTVNERGLCDRRADEARLAENAA